MTLSIISYLLNIFFAIYIVKVIHEHRKCEQQKLKLMDEVSQLRNEYNELNLTYSKINTNYSNLQNKNDSLLLEIDAQQKKIQYYHDKEVEFASKIATMEMTISNLKKESLQKEDIFQKNLRISRETMFEASKNALQKETQNASKNLEEKLKDIFDCIKIHSNKINHAEKLLNTISTPIGAGGISEIHLENRLKSYGLVKNLDFIMQYSTQNNEFRPDSIIFLPNNSIMIIDSKASPDFLRYTSSNEHNEKVEILQRISINIKKQLKSLASKNYKDAVVNSLHKQNPELQINNVITIMFINSEVIIEDLYKLDNNLPSLAREHSIIIAGPTSLVGLLYTVQATISDFKKQKNYEVIVSEIEKLVNNLKTTVDHADSVGKSLLSSMNHYNRFVGSLNKNVLSKVNNIVKLGINNKKGINTRLTKYEFSGSNSSIIDLNIDDN